MRLDLFTIKHNSEFIKHSNALAAACPSLWTQQMFADYFYDCIYGS